ncbi:MAG: peptidase [Candidatus Geothermarchaeales archaeon]
MKKELSGAYEKVVKSVEERRGEITDLLRSLVSTPSVAGSEKEAQEIIINKLKELNLSVDVFEPKLDELKAHPAYTSMKSEEGYEGRPNVVGTLRGSGGGRSIILNGHVDTIPFGEVERWSTHPLSAEIENGKLYGRGACDMKGGVASMIMAVKCVAESGIELKGDVIVQSVIAEEQGGAGTLACLLRGYRADAAVITEPTSLEIQPAQVGAMYGTITVYGKPAHSGWSYEGVSALEKSIKIHDALVDFERERLRSLHHPLAERYPIPPCTLNIGILNAGDYFGKVPEKATMKFRIGVMPGEDYRSVREDIRRLITVLALKDDWMKDHPPEIDWTGFPSLWEPTEIDPSHPIVSTLKEAFKDATGREATLGVMPAGTDMRLFTIYADIPTLLCGPGDPKMAHQFDEYISVEEVITATKVYALTALRWCGV